MGRGFSWNRNVVLELGVSLGRAVLFLLLMAYLDREHKEDEIIQRARIANLIQSTVSGLCHRSAIPNVWRQKQLAMIVLVSVERHG